MTFEYLLVDRPADGVAVVTLNRPEKLNALSYALLRELDSALTEFEGDGDTRCVVIAGSGERAFSAGADIHQQASEAADVLEQQLEWRSRLAWRLATFKIPTIGAINGLVYGGAAVLASTFDLRVGCERSSFRFLAASYGRMNSTWSLPLVVGLPKAKELLFTARIVEADEALRIGLLNHLVPAADLMTASVELAEQIAANSPEMVQGMKRLLGDGVGQPWSDRFEAEHIALTTYLKPGRVTDNFKDFLARKRADTD